MTEAIPGVRMERMIKPEDVAKAALLAIHTNPTCCPQVQMFPT